MSHDYNLNVTVGITSSLKALIERILDESQGKLSPADQALLDGVLLHAAGLTATEEALAAETPPKTP